MMGWCHGSFGSLTGVSRGAAEFSRSWLRRSRKGGMSKSSHLFAETGTAAGVDDTLVFGVDDGNSDTTGGLGGTTGGSPAAGGTTRPFPGTAGASSAGIDPAEPVWPVLKPVCVKSPYLLGTFDAPSVRRASMSPASFASIVSIGI